MLNVNSLIFYIKVTFISYLFIWVRGTLPRFRNKLIYLAWRSLPLSLNYLLFFLGIKLFLLSFL
jgi:NADH-ubiquinone oxidoreductase chain 1